MILRPPMASRSPPGIRPLSSRNFPAGQATTTPSRRPPLQQETPEPARVSPREARSMPALGTHLQAGGAAPQRRPRRAGAAARQPGNPWLAGGEAKPSRVLRTGAAGAEEGSGRGLSAAEGARGGGDLHRCGACAGRGVSGRQANALVATAPGGWKGAARAGPRGAMSSGQAAGRGASPLQQEEREEGGLPGSSQLFHPGPAAPLANLRSAGRPLPPAGRLASLLLSLPDSARAPAGGEATRSVLRIGRRRPGWLPTAIPAGPPGFSGKLLRAAGWLPSTLQKAPGGSRRRHHRKARAAC